MLKPSLAGRILVRKPPPFVENLDDETLMLMVRDGELEHLSLLFERYKGMLHAYYMKRTGEHGFSEDLTQEVFLRIMKYRHSFKHGGSFKAWIFSIARNVRMRQWTKRFSKLHVYASESQQADLDERADPNSEQPDAKTVLEDDKALLYQALEKLSPEKRQIVILRRIQNLSYAEIAEILGCETKSLKVRVHRAVAELASYLKPNLEDSRYELPNAK